MAKLAIAMYRYQGSGIYKAREFSDCRYSTPKTTTILRTPHHEIHTLRMRSSIIFVLTVLALGAFGAPLPENDEDEIASSFKEDGNFEVHHHRYTASVGSTVAARNAEVELEMKAIRDLKKDDSNGSTAEKPCPHGQ